MRVGPLIESNRTRRRISRSRWLGEKRSQIHFRRQHIILYLWNKKNIYGNFQPSKIGPPKDFHHPKTVFEKNKFESHTSRHPKKINLEKRSSSYLPPQKNPDKNRKASNFQFSKK